jgi:glycosyltransferase involved in cell wall biosynthesis
MSSVQKPLPTLLVAIPCYNEAATIGTVVESIPRFIPGVGRVDVLVVDDGSADATADLARASGAIVVRHSRNRGLGNAFQSAVSFAVQRGYDLMLNIDGDGQFSSSDIPRVLAPVLNDDADMATASRFMDKERIPDMPQAKLIGNHMMAFLISKLVNERYHDVSCGFRCYSREALLRINLHGRFTYTQETFLDLSAKDIRIQEVPVSVRYFTSRKSRVASSLLRYGVNTALIIFRSYRDYFPLKFFCFIALIFAVPGILCGGAFFLHFLLTGHFTGYLFLGFTSAFLLGIAAMFVVVAIVADMLDRIRANQDRILYLLKKESSQSGDALRAPQRKPESGARAEVDSPVS